MTGQTTMTTSRTTTTGGTTTDPSAAAPRRRRPHLYVSVRTRMAAVIMVLTTLAMAGAGVTVYAVESDRIDAGVAHQIDQEIAELREFQDNNPVDPETLRPIRDPNVLLEVFLTRNVPDDDEMLVWYAGERLQRTSDPGRAEQAGDLATRNRYGDDFLALPAYQEAVSDMLGTGRTSVLDDTPYGEVWMTSVPVQRAGSDRVEGTLVIINFLLDEHAELNRTLRTYAIVSVLALGVMLLVAVWQSSRLLAPLRTLRETTDEITETDLARRLPERGNDDITALTRTFNDMLSRLELAFVGQRQFLDDAGHELKTPLTVLQGHLELLDVDDPREVEETRQLLLDETDRMSRLVGDLILLAKSDRPDFLTTAPVSLERLTHTLLSKARGLADRSWVLDAAGERVVTLDEQRVTQAVLQLADNAVKHTEEGAEIALGSAVDADAVRLWVRDTGPGIPEADREHVFERFGRSVVRPGDEGFGLGLSIVKAIAEAHHGRVEVDPDHSPGARIVITLPTEPEVPWPAS
jgi:two-component system, OmpR family, sensor kinase